MPFPGVSIIDDLKPRTTALKANQIGANWSEKIRTQSAFSARTTEQSYVDELKRRLMSVAGGEETPQVAQRKLRATLAKIGYTPDKGFPNAPGVAVGTKGSITDLSSEARLRLIMKTNVQQARSMGQMSASQSPILMMTAPAWRLTRTGWRREPRGDWKQRWESAGSSVNWQGACRKEFVALKDSPIWAALGSGAGGFKDTLHEAYPPFAYGSGMAWVHVSRKEAVALGLDVASADPTREQIADYLDKRDKGEIDPRNLPKRMPQKYVDAPFKFDPAALKSAQTAVSTAHAAVKAAKTALDALEASAKEKYARANETLETAVKSGMGADTKALEVAVLSARDAVADEKAKIEGAERGLDALSSRLSMIPMPTSKAEQSAFDAQCAAVKDAAEKYATGVGASASAKAAVAAVEGAARAVSDDVAKRVNELAGKMLAETVAALDAIAEKVKPEREYHKSIEKRHKAAVKRSKALGEDAARRIEGETQTAENAGTAASKKLSYIRDLMSRARKAANEAAADVSTKVAASPSAEAVVDAEKKIMALRMDWTDKINKQLGNYTGAINAYETAVIAFEDAVAEAEKYSFEFDPRMRDLVLGGIKNDADFAKAVAGNAAAERSGAETTVKGALKEIAAAAVEGVNVDEPMFNAKFTAALKRMDEAKAEAESAAAKCEVLKKSVEGMKEPTSDKTQAEYDKACKDVADKSSEHYRVAEECERKLSAAVKDFNAVCLEKDKAIADGVQQAIKDLSDNVEKGNPQAQLANAKQMLDEVQKLDAKFSKVAADANAL